MALPHYRVRLGFGGFLLALGALWTFVSIVFFFTGEPAYKALVNLGLAVFGLAAPGLLLWTSGRARRARYERMGEAAALVRASGRLRVDDAARTMHTTTDRARQALLDAVGEGAVAGRFDAERDLFVAAADGTKAPPREAAITCPRCGATSAMVTAAGEVATCRYCGASA